MSIEYKTKFHVDTKKCIGCSKCIHTCSGQVLEMDEDKHPKMKPFSRYGWRGCWRCEHCLAVCPTGAISIFGKNPEDSYPKPEADLGEKMAGLVSYRRSCRRYQKRNVEPQIIDEILEAMANAPTGGNSCNVEYTVIDDINRVKQIHDLAYAKMEAAAKKGQYTSSFDDFYYSVMKRSEKALRKDDMLFCGAPHLFIAHEKCVGKWAEDSKVNCNLATAYFELLANAYGLGTVIMSYPADVLRELAPQAQEMLGIPKNHYQSLIVGFGYPEIEYARGTQKDRSKKIHRYTKDKNQ